MSSPDHMHRFETRAIHAGQEPDPETGAIMTPVFQTSTYVQPAPGEHRGYEYSRCNNPTRRALEDCLASLEGGCRAVTFSSGCATAATILHLLRQGDHVVCCDNVYGGIYRLFDKVLARFGVEFTFADLTRPEDLAPHLRPETKLVWLESPTNPLLKVLDLAPLCAAAREHGALSVVDNTFMSPYWQNPLDLGADLVMHSTTKFLNGHSDVIGGAVVTRDEDLAEKLFFLQKTIGAVPAPLDCFLTLRGIKTLPLRMERHESNARAVAGYLARQPLVENLVYPGLESHPGHEIAARQARGFGAMISFELKGGLEPSRRFLSATRLFALAESLGGVESLIEHPAIMTHASVEKSVREQIGITDGLVRLSVGVEHVADLIEDLERAFGAAAG